MNTPDFIVIDNVIPEELRDAIGDLTDRWNLVAVAAAALVDATVRATADYERHATAAVKLLPAVSVDDGIEDGMFALFAVLSGLRDLEDAVGQVKEHAYSALEDKPLAPVDAEPR